MIIDCSLFMNEADLLELRLRECENVVDRWLILEARETTRGAPRELVFPQVEERFDRWRDRIDYHVVGMPPADHPHRRFGRFRDLLSDFLPDGGPEDLILISDADEIPRAFALGLLDAFHPEIPVALGMRVFYYWLNLRFRSLGTDGPPGGHGIDAAGWPVWRGPAVCTRRMLDRTSPNQLREGPALGLIPDAGWHWSFLGTVEENQRKLAAQGHIEYDDPAKWSTENLEAARREGRDWDYDRNLPLEWVAIDDTYPVAVRENLSRWLKHVGSEPVKTKAKVKK